MSNKDFDDRVWQKIRRAMQRSAGAHARVGVLASKGGAQDHDGITNVELAAIHEFGLGVKERSFIRRTFDEHKEDQKRLSAKLAKKIVEGKMPLKTALDILGQWGMSEVKKTITTDGSLRSEVPNEQSTIDQKGHSRPLVGGNVRQGKAGGQLANSVNYLVKM